MADQRYLARRSRGFLGPVAGGLLLITTLVAVIALRGPLWELAKVAGRTVSGWLTNWAPAHPRQTAAVVGFGLLTLAINWVAHVRGRLRAWIFALVVEIGLWLLFWYGPGIPSLNELLGFRMATLTPIEIAVSGALVIAVTGVVFWYLELREGWLAYRHRHDVDDD